MSDGKSERDLSGRLIEERADFNTLNSLFILSHVHIHNTLFFFDCIQAMTLSQFLLITVTVRNSSSVLYKPGARNNEKK